MVEDAPVRSSTLPNGRATGDALRLVEGVGQEVSIRAQAAKAMIKHLPVCRDRVDRWILFQTAKNEISTVATSCRAHLPIAGVGGLGKICESSAEFWRAEYSLAAPEICASRKDFALH